MAKHHPLTDWLPTSKKEMEAKGWDEADVILFSGDAYVDHPSFGAAVVGRILEAEGLRVAIVPQPNWRDDLRDFRKLGRPRLFFGVSAGAMDSMVNKYTANRRLRSEDAYTPDRRSDMRPDYPTIVYTRILKELFPDVPVIVGGIEASLRRLTHYDYWQDKLLPGILYQSGADLLIYGMGELPLHEIAQRLIAGEPFDSLKSIRQIAYLVPKGKTPVPCKNDRHLFSHEECLSDKRKQAQNFREIEIQSNRYEADRILQAVGDSTIVVNPPFPPMSTAQIDQSFDLPYTRLPHPRYKGKIISAYEMIKHSVNVHRGCFGGCAFCTISAHQGKFIASRSEASVLREVKEITEMEDFKGYLSDVGGPSANMYKMQGYDLSICKRCKKPSCIHPNVCPNLNADHRPLLDLLRRIDKNPKIKKSFIGSGVRMDLLLHNYKDKVLKKAADEYTEDLIVKHVSGRLKVAPEHSSDRVLNLMRKPPFRQFAEFTKRFQRINEAHGLRQQLIPYFISSHPGCTEEDMAELAILTKKLDFKLEQIQDFTPTPMTLATEMYYTGYHPYTLQPVYTAIKKEEKMRQHMFFFWYKREEADKIRRELHRIGRPDLIAKLFDRTTSSRNDRHTPPSTQPRKGKSKNRHS
ncbi:YgiQ family radical SAM protein [Porphyromonas gingivalis]|uniref:YgiQ family radical SAM protein n=1 Tax=Porphyromonas gingivalis TaxID=837 RepID=UPI00097D697C|nr:YgiQ family radical SAM protein [Porphyromonas gingivalis]MCE8174724.1 YgiQ family radical SAM protein [Porphyromonas gingivalis]WIM90517.1 YgiQ family radical SAM protein [Porphyromonas gingivalis]